MRILTTVAATTAMFALTAPAFAGGLSDQIMEAPVVVEEEMAPAGSSVDPAWIVLGILGLLLLGASGSSDEGGSDTIEQCPISECLVTGVPGGPDT